MKNAVFWDVSHKASHSKDGILFNSVSVDVEYIYRNTTKTLHTYIEKCHDTAYD
jgi:hypothetical protein